MTIQICAREGVRVYHGSFFLRGKEVKLITRIIGIVLIDALTVVLGCEWMIFGVPIILGMHIFRDAPKKRFIFFAVCTIATQFITWGMNVFILLSSGFIAGTLSMFASYFFRTTFYNGKKGKHPVFAKCFFTLFIPSILQ